MALMPRLELRQTQALVMTPQLQQAIKLLQLSNLEITTFVEEELGQNPLLERAEDERNAAGEITQDRLPEDTPALDSPTETLEQLNLNSDAPASGAAESALDVDYDNQFNSNSETEADTSGGPKTEDPFSRSDPYYAPASGAPYGDDLPGLDQTLSAEQSFRDFLMDQVNMDLSDPVDRMIAILLIDNLDESGYFRGNLDAVADSLGCPVARVEKTLLQVQRFEPSGIFARDLAECLANQLRERNRLDPAMAIFVENLDRLARHDIDGLVRVCGVDREDILDMVKEIKALDPKPALAFDQTVVQPVIPDVLMRAKSDGGWAIELNTDTLPKVLVNNSYYATVHSSAQSKDDKQYIANCLQTANWLVKSLHQRATTILRVSTEIVRQQDAFFTHGIQHLKPLVLKDIATVIDMHESTVSRVTSNKYIATPRGIFELKYFFTTAIGSSSGGDTHSAEAVRHRIKALINAEMPKKILSDDKIVDILKKEGIDIARRTVAKYREAMRIPSSVQRRREKASQM